MYCRLFYVFYELRGSRVVRGRHSPVGRVVARASPAPPRLVPRTRDPSPARHTRHTREQL